MNDLGAERGTDGQKGNGVHIWCLENGTKYHGRCIQASAYSRAHLMENINVRY